MKVHHTWLAVYSFTFQSKLSNKKGTEEIDLQLLKKENSQISNIAQAPEKFNLEAICRWLQLLFPSVTKMRKCHWYDLIPNAKNNFSHDSLRVSFENIFQNLKLTPGLRGKFDSLNLSTWTLLDQWRWMRKNRNIKSEHPPQIKPQCPTVQQ